MLSASIIAYLRQFSLWSDSRSRPIFPAQFLSLVSVSQPQRHPVARKGRGEEVFPLYWVRLPYPLVRGSLRRSTNGDRVRLGRLREPQRESLSPLGSLGHCGSADAPILEKPAPST